MAGICAGVPMKIVNENGLLNGQDVTVKTGREKHVTISNVAACLITLGKVLTLETIAHHTKQIKILGFYEGTARYTVFEYEDVEVPEPKSNSRQHHKNNNTREKQCPRHR